MKKIINFIKNYTFGVILGILLTGVVGVYAVSKMYATSISIDISNINGLSNGATLDTALTDLYKKTTSTTCPVGYKCFEKKLKPEIGDYIKMTPTSTSYTTDTTYTGHTSNQTINPSELNLWRVIKVNSDGTIEMVSEYVSTTAVSFKGQIGYRNLVGYLNVLANQYQNTKYTIKARHMGYNGQTEYLTDTENTVDSTEAIAPWTSSTGNSTIESQGGGDKLYTTDTDLVKSALGTLVAMSQSGISKNYHLASRYYLFSNSTYWYYSARVIDASGIVRPNLSAYVVYDNEFKIKSYNYSLRPILTLKSDIEYTPALGTSDDPFVLE